MAIQALPPAVGGRHAGQGHDEGRIDRDAAPSRAARRQGRIQARARVILTLLALGAAASSAVAEDVVTLASGAIVTLQERLIEQGEDGFVYRFRFIEEGFDAATRAPEILRADLTNLCSDYALHALSQTDIRPDRIIISLADRAVEFGVSDPDARQVFEVFSIEDDICIWEMF